MYFKSWVLVKWVGIKTKKYLPRINRRRYIPIDS
jgi:hypothetical protein